MASLIDKIPVYKPQTIVSQNSPNSSVVNNNSIVNAIKNKYPQDKIYSYIPATPITQPKLKPVGVTSHPASGTLIKENVFESAASTVKSYANYTKYFYDAAFKGEGTDYKVGKINDLAIRLGSLGIATVLATTKLFPFAKGMEFVGLTTWFASMAVWPKLMAAPIKALYGVDINQKYLDSYGRRKAVFEDNQYRPMDLYRYVDENGKPLTKDEYHKKYKDEYVYLNKIADKLNIPKDIKNRNEAAMNEMGQIAVQARTLGMGTAGIMTPVLSSIAADAVQTPLKNFMSEQRYKQQTKNLSALEKKLNELLGVNGFGKVTDIEAIANKLDVTISKDLQSQFNTLLSDSGELTKEQFENLERFLEEKFFGTGFHTSIKSAMTKDSKMSEPFITVGDELKNALNQISKEAFAEVLESIPQDKRHLIPAEFWNYKGFSVTDVENLLKKLQIQNGETIGLHKGNALYSNFAAEVVSPFEKFQVIENPNYQEQIKIIEQEFELAKQKAWQAYDKAIEQAGQKAEELARSAGKSQEEISRAVWDAKSAIKKPKIRKQIVSEQTVDANVSKLMQKLVDKLNQKMKAYVDSQRRYIVSREEITKLFKFAETNRQLVEKIKAFESATIKNISESATAISWENIPQKYLKVFNFTNKELAMLAMPDATTASKVVARKMEELVQNPDKYQKAIIAMSELAQNVINKDERALIQLIGTIEKPGILFKAKELMESVAKENFGGFMQDSIETFYYGKIANVQRKLRNTTDSLVRPLKALDLFKNIDSVVEYILGKESEYLIRQKNPDYHMFKDMGYNDAVKSLKAYIKDIVLQKNDINDWTTKMEVELPGLKKGLKNSKAVLCSLSDMIWGDLHTETKLIIENSNLEKIVQNKEFLQKLLANNKIMRARFLSLHNPLLKHMTEGNALGGMIEDLKNPATAKESAKMLLEMIKDRFADVGTLTSANNNRFRFDSLRKYQKLLTDFYTGVAFGDYKIEPAISTLKEAGALPFNTANKALSEMSGKNITDFFASAAQNMRARNKWAKLVYALLGGTFAITAITILNMGKNNNLNPHIYEKKNSSKGAIK